VDAEHVQRIIHPAAHQHLDGTVWVLVAAFLVFGMQVGFQMLETGFARTRETVNILVEGIVDTCICGVLFWAFGFAFMFEPGTPLIGTSGFSRAWPTPMAPRACRCWPSGSSSLPLPTPPRPSPPAR
jgi:ammonia channel protein AmtB